MHMKSKRPAWGRSLMLILAAVLAVSLAACGKKDDSNNSGTKDSSKTIAEYKDGTVTEKEFTTFTNVLAVINPQMAPYIGMAEYKNMLLDQYIGYNLIYEGATKEAKDKATKDAETEYAKVEEAVTKDKLEEELKASSITAADVKDFIRLSIGVSETMAAKVTDDEVTKYFNDNKQSLIKVDVRHILVGFKDAEGKERSKEDALKRAKEAKSKVEAAGADWNALAKEYSDDPGSSAAGGLYANSDPSQYVEAFKKACLEQKVGVVGDPVETEYGYHVVLVEKRDEPTLETSKQTIKETLGQTKLNDYMQNELPKLITKKEEFKDPSPSPAASPAAGATASPAASPSPSPAK